MCIVYVFKLFINYPSFSFYIKRILFSSIVPTFATFLQDIESPYEVKDYIKGYLGESRECAEFAKQFLERRSKYKNQQRAQYAHIDDMCSPAPAINPSNEFQEVKVHYIKNVYFLKFMFFVIFYLKSIHRRIFTIDISLFDMQLF